MDTFLRLQVYIVCISMLMIIFIKIINEQDKNNFPNKVFLRIIFFILCILTAEAVEWIYDGRPGTGARFLVTVANILEQALITAPGILWMIYADYFVYNKIGRSKKLFKLFSIILVYFAILSVSSPFNHLLFYIDSLNRYHRGVLYWQSQSIYIVFFIYGAAVLFINRKKLTSSIFAPLFLFPIPILIGMIFQIIYYGLSTAWCGAVISIMIIYICIQSQKSSEDYLTGLYNRRQLDTYLESILKNNKSCRIISILMIDIDKFKKINDTWGHDMGDRALRQCADILRKCFHHKDFIARYAGDEFIVILELNNSEDVYKIIKRLKAAVKASKDNEKVPYNLSLSVGYALFPEDGQEADEILKIADKRMYLDKNNNE